MKAKGEERTEGRRGGSEEEPLSCRTSGHQVARIEAHYVRGLIVMQKLTVANGVIGVSVFNGPRTGFGSVFLFRRSREEERVCAA